MPLRIRFFKDFNGFWKQNGTMLASKIGQKSMFSSRGDFLKNFVFLLGKSMILGIRGSKLEAKFDQKSIKIRGQHAKASSHGFFIDFGGFWEPSWEAKSTQDRLKIAPKN